MCVCVWNDFLDTICYLLSVTKVWLKDTRVELWVRIESIVTNLRDQTELHHKGCVYIYIYIYIYISQYICHPQRLYQNSSVCLDTRDSSSWDRNPVDFPSVGWERENRNISYLIILSFVHITEFHLIIGCMYIYIYIYIYSFGLVSV